MSQCKFTLPITFLSSLICFRPSFIQMLNTTSYFSIIIIRLRKCYRKGSIELGDKMILCMQQLTIYCLSPVIAYSAKMQLEPLNRFPLPAGTMLNIINKDHWRDTSGERAFPFLVPACSSARAQLLQHPAPASFSK